MKIQSFSKSDIDTKYLEEVISQCQDLSSTLKDIDSLIFDLQIENLSSITALSGLSVKQLEALLRNLAEHSNNLTTIRNRAIATKPKITQFRITEETPIKNLIGVLDNIKIVYAGYKQAWLGRDAKLSEDERYYGQALLESINKTIVEAELAMSEIDDEVKKFNFPDSYNIPILIER